MMTDTLEDTQITTERAKMKTAGSEALGEARMTPTPGKTESCLENDQIFRQNNVNPTVGRYNSRDYNSGRQEQEPVNDNGQGYRDNSRNNDEGREIESR